MVDERWETTVRGRWFVRFVDGSGTSVDIMGEVPLSMVAIYALGMCANVGSGRQLRDPVQSFAIISCQAGSTDQMLVLEAR